MADPTRCWFFGCWSPDKIGHFLWRSQFDHLRCCPAGETWTFDMRDRLGAGDIGQRKLGVWHRTVVNGCTVIACWDRSADSRRNSNAAFIVEGEHDIATALAIARQHFPDQVARILTQFEEPTQVENG